MSGASILTTSSRDELAQIIKNNISYFLIGEGGFILSSIVNRVLLLGITVPSKSYSYVLTGGSFTIIGISLVDNSITISGEHTEVFASGFISNIHNTTQNDGLYIVASSAIIGSNTVIYLSGKDLVSSSVDGLISVDLLPIAKGGPDGNINYSLVVKEITSGDAIRQTLTDVSGNGVLTGNGSGNINYKNGNLSVTFASNTLVGSRIVVSYKFSNARKETALCQGLTSLIATNSRVLTDGKKELFSFKKTINPSDITFRGSGTGTIRVRLLLSNAEGIDDGRGLTFGGTPYYYEAGIFTNTDKMIAYMTFDKEKKIGSSIISHNHDFIF